MSKPQEMKGENAGEVPLVHEEVDDVMLHNTRSGLQVEKQSEEEQAGKKTIDAGFTALESLGLVRSKKCLIVNYLQRADALLEYA